MSHLRQFPKNNAIALKAVRAPFSGALRALRSFAIAIDTANAVKHGLPTPATTARDAESGK